jgi:hypothetical protein
MNQEKFSAYILVAWSSTLLRNVGKHLRYYMISHELYSYTISIYSSFAVRTGSFKVTWLSYVPVIHVLVSSVYSQLVHGLFMGRVLFEKNLFRHDGIVK